MERFEAIKQFKGEIYPNLDLNFYEALKNYLIPNLGEENLTEEKLTENTNFSIFSKRLGADLETVATADKNTFTFTLSSDDDSNPYSSSSYMYSITIDFSTGKVETDAFSKGFIFSKWQEYLFDFYYDNYLKAENSTIVSR